jgi:TetR/AcrR family transcriptional regulator, transcriptional repressor for nem operon
MSVPTRRPTTAFSDLARCVASEILRLSRYQPVGMIRSVDAVTATKAKPDARARLLDAAMQVIRAQGYSATSVDDICRAAGLTKGAFFHHFKSKEELGVAAAAHFSAMAEGLFAAQPYRTLDDPLERVLGYVDFRAAIIDGPIPEFTCLLGTMVQEVYATHPAIRQACDTYIGVHAAAVAKDIAAAKARYAPNATWSADSLALHMQAVLQGAYVLAKAKNDNAIARDCVAHLRRYLELLFRPSN